MPWLFLLAAFLWAPAMRAQVIGVQDVFSYVTSNLNGHAPTTGTGDWIVSTTGTNAGISTTGTSAVVNTNISQGGAPGTGQAVGYLPFTAQPNTLYTITTTLDFTKLSGTADCWFAAGFDDNQPTNTGPYMFIRPQSTGTTNTPQAACNLNNNYFDNSINVPAADYAAPIVVTITWNTATGVAQFFIDSVLQCSGTLASPNGQYYAYIQGFQTGSAVSVLNNTVSAQTVGISQLAMQDNFTYTTSNINNHAPTAVMGSGWSTNWSSVSSSGTISTNGSLALISTNGGSPGSGSVTANFAFHVSPNTLYTLRGAFNYSLMGSSIDCWTGFGFSNSSGTNVAPWMFVRPQAVSTDNPGTGFNVNNSWFYNGTCPAADYSAPVTMTVTWNTATGIACYYIDDILQATGTSAVLPNGTFNAFVEGFKTGNLINMTTVALTAQPVPQVPEVWFSPSDITPTNFNTIFDSGTVPCTWPTARSHTQVINFYGKNFFNTNYFSGTQQQIAFINYLEAHNIQLAICTNPLLETSDTCTHREGYDSTYDQTQAVSVIQAAIAASNNPAWAPAYLSLDEPLGVCEIPDGGCSMPAIATAAQQTATTIGYFKNAWPGIKVVEYEGFSQFPQADVASWFADMAADGGTISGIIDDFNWYICATGSLASVATTCANAGVSYGLFYDGFAGVPGGTNTTPQFLLGQKINIQCYNASTSPAPARVEVATWGNPVPAGSTCPESSGTTLSNALDIALTSPYVLQTPPFALYQVAGNGYYARYTNSYSQYVSWSGTGGYTGIGVLGGLAPTATFAGIQGLVPLYLYFNSSINQYALSLSTADADLNSYGYTMQSTLGYALPTSTGAAMGGVPLYSTHKYILPVNQYNYTNTQPNPANLGPYNTFLSQYGYWAEINNNNPVAYLLPNFFHNGYGSYGPY
jgi:hypothetical protein